MVDLWSLGVVLAELLISIVTNKLLYVFYLLEEDEIHCPISVQRVLLRYLRNLPRTTREMELGIDLVSLFLRADPNHRITVAASLKHPFLLHEEKENLLPNNCQILSSNVPHKGILST